MVPPSSTWWFYHNLAAIINSYKLSPVSQYYPLVNANKKQWKITMFDGSINYKSTISMAMFNINHHFPMVFPWFSPPFPWFTIEAIQDPTQLAQRASSGARIAQVHRGWLDLCRKAQPNPGSNARFMAIN